MMLEVNEGKGPIYMRTEEAIQKIVDDAEDEKSAKRTLKKLEAEAWEDFLDMTISQAVLWAAKDVFPEEGPSEIMPSEPYFIGSHSGASGAAMSAPSISAAAFAERFDGFSIGSNDLTQLTLGIDRDSDRLAGLFDERHPAVRWMIESVIERAHKVGAKVGLCGQAPSNYPDFAKVLVAAGIDTISVTPDSFLEVKANVAEAESKAKRVA